VTFLAWLVCWALVADGGEKASKPAVDLFEHFEKTPSAPIENVARGVYRIGGVTVDQTAGVVTIPARMNAPTWSDVEYLAVAERGKDHESVVIVQAEPFHVNLACILAGLTGGPPLAQQGDPRVPQGSRVKLWMEWEQEGKAFKVPAEEFLWDRKTGKPMERTTWVYTGSRFDEEGRFLAQLSRSLIAVFHDPDALIDNPLKGGGRSPPVRPHEKVCPPQGTPLTVRIERVMANAKGKPVKTESQKTK